MATSGCGRGGLWGWVQAVGSTCGLAGQSQRRDMCVRANPAFLFPYEIPGMDESVLAQVRAPGGSLEEKLQYVIETFRNSARHVESLQQVLTHRAMEQREKVGADPFPVQVEHVISSGSYQESFLEDFDGQSFLLYSEEIVPSHAYRLALEVHSGGPYWSSIPVQDTGAQRQRVETVSASSGVEGSATAVAHFGGAQRGAVLVWRWRHLCDAGPYDLPQWLAKTMNAEGNDPLRKLQGELEVVRRWEQQQRLDTAQHIKAGVEIKDLYIREVLRLWPCEPEPHGREQPKKCARVEGLDEKLFVGRTVLVYRARYDDSHVLLLHAMIARRHTEDSAQESSPPFRLTTTWHWAAASLDPTPEPH